jgi:lysophospholipase L1-like esterase
MKSHRFLLLCLLLVLPREHLWSESSSGSAGDVRLQHVLQKARNGEGVNVAFLGGSITKGAAAHPASASWPGLTESWLRNTFPTATWTFINASVPGTGSDLGVFRMDAEILDKMTPDLVFVEFAVNDQGRGDSLVIGGAMEGIVRKTLAANPKAAIVFVYTLSKYIYNKLGNGQPDPATIIHKNVASHYGISEVDFQQAVLAKLGTKGWEWKEYWADDAHPNNKGHELYARAVIEHLEQALLLSETDIPNGTQPAAPLYTSIFDHVGAWLPEPVEGWVAKDIPSQIKGHVAPHLLQSTPTPHPLKIAFEGPVFGFCFVSSTETGTVQVSVDGSTPRRVDSHIDTVKPPVRVYSRIIFTDLAPGPHQAEIEIVTEPNGPRHFNLAAVLSQKTKNR